MSWVMQLMDEAISANPGPYANPTPCFNYGQPFTLTPH